MIFTEPKSRVDNSCFLDINEKQEMAKNSKTLMVQGMQTPKILDKQIFLKKGQITLLSNEDSLEGTFKASGRTQ